MVLSGQELAEMTGTTRWRNAAADIPALRLSSRETPQDSIYCPWHTPCSLAGGGKVS
jgi:hypothetical protein